MYCMLRNSIKFKSLKGEEYGPEAAGVLGVTGPAGVTESSIVWTCCLAAAILRQRIRPPYFYCTVTIDKGISIALITKAAGNSRSI